MMELHTILVFESMISEWAARPEPCAPGGAVPRDLSHAMLVVSTHDISTQRPLKERPYDQHGFFDMVFPHDLYRTLVTGSERARP